MKSLLPVLCLFLSVQALAQKVENVIVITTDGLRWQEVFGGMDSAIANNKKFNQNDSTWIYRNYWAKDAQQRRELLMPSLWKLAGKHGQLYGNRWKGNKVDNANRYWFSYPGYNEIFTGYPDTAINSNEYPPNPHVTVLEYLHRMPGYKGKVAAFGAWEAFDRILNEQRAGFQVVSAFDTTSGQLTERQKLINSMLLNSPRPFHNGECLDLFTHFAAFEYMKQHKPRILYVSYGETDEWAHAGYYRFYLDAAKQVDAWIGELWNYVQSQPQYRDKTALVITTDHGRGDKVKAQWTSHGQSVEDAGEIWFAVLSPGIKASGEVTVEMQLYQKQLAATIASLLGKKYTPMHPVAEPVSLLK
jgi:hypothetical protein